MLYRLSYFSLPFSVVVTTCFLIVAGVGVYILAPDLVGLFNDDIPQVKAQVVDIGATTLRFTAITFPLVGFMVLANMMMQNLSMAFRASFLAMARQGLFYIPLVLILPHILGFVGIQMCQAISDVISFVITIVLVVGVIKELNEKEKNQKNPVA